jgi:hypothetical protein
VNIVKKTYQATFKVVTSGGLSFETVVLFERYQIIHGKGLQKYWRTERRKMERVFLVDVNGHLSGLIKRASRKILSSFPKRMTIVRPSS